RSKKGRPWGRLPARAAMRGLAAPTRSIPSLARGSCSAPPSRWRPAPPRSAPWRRWSPVGLLRGPGSTGRWAATTWHDDTAATIPEPVRVSLDNQGRQALLVRREDRDHQSARGGAASLPDGQPTAPRREGTGATPMLGQLREDAGAAAIGAGAAGTSESLDNRLARLGEQGATRTAAVADPGEPASSRDLVKVIDTVSRGQPIVSGPAAGAQPGGESGRLVEPASREPGSAGPAGRESVGQASQKSEHAAPGGDGDAQAAEVEENKPRGRS
ncbi:unnamed protein product, partial [Prorocentrum cordatum]